MNSGRLAVRVRNSDRISNINRQSRELALPFIYPLLISTLRWFQIHWYLPLKTGLIEFIADMLWSSGMYHGNSYRRKIWPDVIIFTNQRKKTGLISTRLFGIVFTGQNYIRTVLASINMKFYAFTGGGGKPHDIVVAYYFIILQEDSRYLSWSVLCDTICLS